MSHVYEFGPFRLDADMDPLFRKNNPIAIGRRAATVLRILLESRGSAVSRDKLLVDAWSGLSVEEANLSVQIASLRRALGEEPGGESWLETLPRRGYRYVGPEVSVKDDEVGALAAASPPMDRSFRDKPSIAVLPFQNLSTDPEQDYFTDGVVEDLTTALSRFRELFVIARNSSFTYKGRPVDVKQVSPEFGVRYVVEGSVRKSEDRIRITGQLIDASSGVHLWADRFEGTLHDLFRLQDEITACLVGKIAPKIQQAEIERARRKPTESLDAYDYYLRGLSAFYRGTRQSTADALRLFQSAVERDHNFIAAHAMPLWALLIQNNNGWLADPAKERAMITSVALRVARIGKEEAIALCCSGLAQAQVAGDVATGAALIDQSLLLNPNFATAWHMSGWVRIYLSDPEAALERFERAIMLNPVDPLLYGILNGTAAAHFLAERYDQSSAWAERALREQPTYLPSMRLAAASHALAGRLSRAQELTARIREAEPHSAYIAP